MGEVGGRRVVVGEEGRHVEVGKESRHVDEESSRLLNCLVSVILSYITLLECKWSSVMLDSTESSHRCNTSMSVSWPSS